MASENSDFTLVDRKIGPWTIPTIRLGEGESQSLRLHIAGYIVNSVPSTGQKARLQQWKVQIASEVKAARGATAWNPEARFVIFLGFRFNARNHGSRKLDVENYLKPVVDALAAGLFCDERKDPKAITHWNYDDSNFNTLLAHRLPDADTKDGEGIALYVSSC